jgi:hypothetical protein
MKTNLIVLLLLVIVPFTASSQVTLTPTQTDNLVRLINDYESLQERHAIVIGRLTEAEEIIWKYGDLVNECERLKQQCELELNYNLIKNTELKKKLFRNRVISVVSVGVAVLAFIIT